MSLLESIFSNNNKVGWLISDYLSCCPKSITKELIDAIDIDGILPEERLYSILLCRLCGLDTETNPNDRELDDSYFSNSVNRLDASKYRTDPYYLNIDIPEISIGKWKLTKESYEPYEAFICDDIVITADKRVIPQIGYFTERFSFPAILENDQEWMAIKPNEIATMRDAIDAVSGDVVTFGLGMGYFAYMSTLKQSVKSLTIIEKDDTVISIFERYILPQFSDKQRDIIRIVKCDAFDYISTQMKEGHFDYAFVDLWHDLSDGVDIYLTIKEMEHFSPHTKFIYWIEKSLKCATQQIV